MQDISRMRVSGGMNKRGFAGDQDGQFLIFVLTLQGSQPAAARPISYHCLIAGVQGQRF